MMKANEIRQKTTDELKTEMTELYSELFKLRMQKGAGEVARPHAFKRIKRQIARIKTILNEKVSSV